MVPLLILGKWTRRLLIAGVLILLFIWLLPTIIAHSPLLDSLVERAAKDVDGSVAVGGASLGWFSPVVLHDVSVKDSGGQVLLKVAKVETERSLLGLLLDSSNPGRLECDQACIDIVLHKNSSNWERAFAKLLTPKPGSIDNAAASNHVAAPLRLAVNFRAARIAVHEAGAKQEWTLGPLDASLAVNKEGAAPLQIEVRTSAVSAYGCDLGPIDSRGQLEAGRLHFALAETTLNGGKLRLAGNARLGPAPVEVQLNRGLVVDHAQLTSALCAGGLRYAVPALAGVTEVQGVVSLALDENHIHPADRAKTALKGTLSLHSARVGATPLLRELSGLLAGQAPAFQITEKSIPLEISGGRVHHHGFELSYNELVVRTSGSVGFDGSLALVAEMPVPTKWLAGNPLAASFAKQTIRLPIGGTIDHPRVDQQALQATSAQFLRDSAKDAIREGLDGNLKKLFGGR